VGVFEGVIEGVGVKVGVLVGVTHPKHGVLPWTTTIQSEKTPVHSSPVKKILPSAAHGMFV
jgi:hypothetical protein